MGYIIDIYAYSWGAAKTTTSLSLGHVLAKKGLKTLVVDIDSQCNISETLIGIDPQNNLMDILSQSMSVEECIHQTECHKNLSCLPNISELVNIESKLMGMGVDGFSFLRDNIQDYCRENFDITIIDCPTNQGILTFNALMCADLVIVPTDAGTRNSIKGLKNALAFIDDIKKDKNPDLKFLKLLITRLDNRTPIGNDYLNQLRDLFEDQIFDTSIPKNVDFQYAENQKKTIFQSNPKASGAKAYMNVATEIIGLLGLQ